MVCAAKSAQRTRCALQENVQRPAPKNDCVVEFVQTSKPTRTTAESAATNAFQANVVTAVSVSAPRAKWYAIEPVSQLKPIRIIVASVATHVLVVRLVRAVFANVHPARRFVLARV